MKDGRVILLDGAMGTMLQRHGLGGNNEMFNLTAPDVVRSIHEEYISAGAEIIETNSFGANRIAQAEYGTSDRAAEMALAAARLAREAADSANGRKVLVAGSIGPTSKSLSLSTDPDDPSSREIDFDAMEQAFREQAGALVEGGADLILIETCFDALNAKAAIHAVMTLEKELGRDIPVMVSVSVSDRSGRTLTGQSLRAFYESVRHCHLYSFGLNCSLGARQMKPLMEEVAAFVHEDNAASGRTVKVSCYPNAGLPDGLGGYDETPEEMAAAISDIVREGLADIVGGCCGTTPEHISAIVESISALSLPDGRTPRPEASGHALSVSGLEAVTIDRRTNNFTNIGERTNVAGSRKFARMVAGGDWRGAMETAAEQIEAGARIIDINMDDPLLDGTACMRKFVRLTQAEPAVAKAALMIDSSHWETILAGLKNVQGKCIVNSISLKDGEKEFLRKAAEIRPFGAAMVVMAFDEEGQAVTYERKISICRRAYDLLTGAGIEASDIIFDVNVLSVGTGTGEDRRYAADFIEAVRWIKTNLPGALTSGGISNLSFAFRGNNEVRGAMHSVFLYHAISAGLDMAIVNPSMLKIYDGIDPELRRCAEDVILDSDAEAAGRLLEIAGRLGAQKENARENTGSDDGVKEERSLQDMLVAGNGEGLEAALDKALAQYGNASVVIEGPLMDGMRKVGELFAQGKMFLPQVIKSARIMKEAAAHLGSAMSAADGGSERPVFVIATVKGDVHDIGKDITATVLNCNGFDVKNLGVMVDNSTILRKAEEYGADIIGVSGLISPSLEQMENLCRMMGERGLDTPLLVGGATTSALHTAVKLAPLYAHVFHRPDASSCAVLAGELLRAREETERREHDAQRRLAALHASGRTEKKTPAAGSPASFEDAADIRKIFAYLPEDGYAPEGCCADFPVSEIPLEAVAGHIDWKMFLAIWNIKATDYDNPQVRAILDEAKGRLSVLPCRIVGGMHFTGSGTGLFAASVHRLSGVVSDTPHDGTYGADGHQLSGGVSDTPYDGTYGADGVGGADGADGADGHTAADGFGHTDADEFGHTAADRSCSCGCGHCEENLMDDSLRLVLADAAAQWMESVMTVPEGYRVIRPAPGYPSCPDHSLKRGILSGIPDSDRLGITLTESFAMLPDASVCGFVIIHRDARYK